MKDENNYRVVIKLLHEAGLMYAFIGELISADNNLSKEDEVENRRILGELISTLEGLTFDSSCEIPADDINRYLELAKKSRLYFLT